MTHEPSAGRTEQRSLPDVVDPPMALGRRRFVQGIGALAGAALVGALPSGSAWAAVPAGATRFVPLPKGVRLADTRSPSEYPFTRIAANRIRVKVRDRDGVPPSATAVVLTVTGKNFDVPDNFITVYPTGAASLPEASNLNLPKPQETNANLVFAKVGKNHSVDVYQMAACHSIVDVLGYFVPVDDGVRAGRYVGLAESKRALDTRPNFVRAQSFTTVDVTALVPSTAASVVINLTALSNPGWGFFTAVPYSVTTPPQTSSLNVVTPGDKRAAAVIVPVETVGGKRLIKIFAHGPAKLLVDVMGYFTGSGAPQSQDGLFVVTDPTRVLDTRKPDPAGRLWPKWVVEATVPGAAASAAAVVVNVTSARTRGEGFLTVSGARRPIPNTSNVNWVTPGATVPNLAVTPVTSGYGFQVYDESGGHVIADMAGYFTGPQKTASVPKYPNPAPPSAPPTWTLRVPRIGLTSTVLDGDPDAVTDAGYSWHWTNTGDMGEPAHVGLFAHRTSAGGPYRNIHLIQPGDTWTITTSDRREYTYRMVRRDLTSSAVADILAATRRHAGRTCSLIACSKTNFLPTSLSWRIVVTGEIVSWREL